MANALLAALFWLVVSLPAATPVAIGYYGPNAVDHPLGGPVWEGVQFAFEGANAEGERFHLTTGWDENPWTGGAAIVARMAFQRKVAAIIGSINGTATHLAEQVVAKAQLPLVDPASTDRTVNAAFVPWMFSVMPDDRAFMKALTASLPDEPFVLLTATNHDSRMMNGEFLRQLGRRRPLRHLEFDDPTGIAKRAVAFGASVVVVLAGPAVSARIVRELRSADASLRIYASQNAGRRLFREQAGDAAAGVRYPSPGPIQREFAARFERRYGHPPDFAAAHGYDAARLVIAAVQRGGADRDAIRQALLALSPYSGVSGPITWDKLRRNARSAVMATVTR